jgi:rhodanese-related sulfurtransferase
VKNLTVHEAREKQRAGYTYVDVRSEPEYAQGHPEGAVNVPLLHRDERSGQLVPNPDFLRVMRENFAPDAKLLIGCQVGGRSAQATQLLASAGYSDVSNVLGGYGGARDPMTGAVRAEGWTQAGLPIETSAASGASYAELRAARRENT